MGLIKYIAPAAEISGTIGGVTYARTHDAKIARSWRAPVNKRRDRQLAIRVALSAAASAWFDKCTQVQRDGWDTYAATCTFTNPLGEDYEITGFNMFVRSHSAWGIWSLGTQVPPVAEPLAPPPTTGFPPTHTTSNSFVHFNGTLTILSIAPVLVAGQWQLTTINHWIKASRRYPKAPVITKTAVSVYPATIQTFPAPLPGAPGDQRAIYTWRFWDTDNRLSKPVLETLLSV
jgi:hypothetical protein